MLTPKKIPSWSWEWWLIIIGLACLYLPMYYKLSTSIWLNDEYTQGPMALGIVLFLFWQKRDCFAAHLSQEVQAVSGPANYTESQPPVRASTRGSSVVGVCLLTLGLACHFFGYLLDSFTLKIGSQITVFSGILLITSGFSLVRAIWFPLFFIVFMIPLPGAIVDAVTLPMKLAVSNVVEHILFYLNLPIAREGVMLHVGQYKLMVADACAGLHTLISLEAMGLLYLHLVKHDLLFRNITMGALIVPISFTANVIRVIVLVLVTYYFGDSAGQGFIHGFAGILLFVVALSLIILIDTVLHRLTHQKTMKLHADPL
jgi:exosortase B